MQNFTPSNEHCLPVGDRRKIKSVKHCIVAQKSRPELHFKQVTKSMLAL